MLTTNKDKMDSLKITAMILGIFIVIVAGLFFSLFLYLIHESEQLEYSCPDCNVILISVDTLRADHLGCYGYERDTSPNIDSLADHSLLFENAFSQSSRTTPSHMTMFTSLYPSVHSLGPPEPNITDILNPERTIVDARCLSQSIKTLPEILKENGYETAGFTGGGNVAPYLGFGRGFGEYNVYYTLFDNDLILNETLSWIEENKKDKFFLFFHTYKVHSPYISPEPYFTMFDTNYSGKILNSLDEIKGIINFSGSVNGNNSEWVRLSIGIGNAFWNSINKSSESDIEHIVSTYDGSIRYVDNVIGSIIHTINELGIRNKTLIILTADHGEEFAEHGGLGHVELYDEIIHVPLIISIPDQKPKRFGDDVMSIDIMPTILGILGTNANITMQGTSIISTPLGKAEKKNNVVFSEISLGGERKSVRSNGWKYYFSSSNQDNEMLFNLAEDPKELINLKHERPHVIYFLKEMLNKWSEQNSILKEHMVADKNTKVLINNETLEKLIALGYVDN